MSMNRISLCQRADREMCDEIKNRSIRVDLQIWNSKKYVQLNWSPLNEERLAIEANK